jgi:hypothetical protein
MSQVYLPNNDFLNQWRALSLDEMKAQPAFQAVLDYYKTKGQIEPTYGQYLEPNGRVVVTMVFTDPTNAGNSQWIEAADAVCDALPTLSRLRQVGISKTNPNSYDPFNWTPPVDPAVPALPTKLVKPVYVVGDSYDGGVSYMNMGPIPYVGAETSDPRGTFIAKGHETIGGVTFYWVPKVAPAPPTPVQPTAPVNPFAGFTRDQLMAFLMQALAGAK